MPSVPLLFGFDCLSNLVSALYPVPYTSLTVTALMPASLFLFHYSPPPLVGFTCVFRRSPFLAAAGSVTSFLVWRWGRKEDVACTTLWGFKDDSLQGKRQHGVCIYYCFTGDGAQVLVLARWFCRGPIGLQLVILLSQPPRSWNYRHRLQPVAR